MQYPGDGFSIMSYSKHPTEAAEFIKFLATAYAAEDHLERRPDPGDQGLQTNN